MTRKGTARRHPIEGPFAPEILEKARATARSYRILLEPDPREGYVGSALEIPSVFSRGLTPDHCVEATYKALTVAVATMLEAGVTPPRPLAAGRREEQMNVRLDPEEKLVLRETAKQRGYRSASDYVRAIALRDARKAS